MARRVVVIAPEAAPREESAESRSGEDDCPPAQLRPVEVTPCADAARHCAGDLRRNCRRRVASRAPAPPARVRVFSSFPCSGNRTRFRRSCERPGVAWERCRGSAVV